ncbi:hypothetical protein [Vulcaniibacterium gelatinicum]|uniref:hypothetical protein n=1 Tax=Vulcaniibacterium gelatinicum TaxID=2598725 RepID=UPI0011CA3F53|nr:hypothetical protein [Vulcaniibacterium gelatinicum]
MSLNKNALSIAIAGALVFAASSAHAAVTLGVTPTNTPVTVATEAFGTADASGTTFTNAGSALDIITPVNYAFSNGEVRYARIECPSNVKFNAGSAVSYTDGGGGVGTVALGAINGLGTNVIFFSVTATAAGVGDNALDRFTINGDRTITLGSAASCSYSLYDQPSQAQAGGSNGRITVTSGAYINFASGYTFFTNGQQTLTADVEANTGAFTKFTSAGPVSATLGRLTAMRYDNAPGVQIDEDGLDIDLTDIFGATTSINVAGDFSFVTGLANAFLASDTACATVVAGGSADALTATAASFTVGSTAHLAGADVYLCVAPNTTTPIPAGSYNATLNAVVANPAEYSAVSTGPLAAGSIVRNGTQLQAPLVQLPSGWLSRMVLTNTGSAARPYTITVQGESGNTITTNGANLTGTVPANGTIVVDLNTVLTGFTGSPRATLNVTVAGPNSQIQGLYQIVNPASGSISNHVMVRPGTN